MSKEINERAVKELLAANVLLMATPTLMDDLIEELESRNLYRHELKRTLKSLLKDFEAISTAGYKAMNPQNIGSQLVTEAMEFADKVKECVLLEGLDAITSIIDSLLVILIEKFQLLGEHYYIKKGILYLERMRRVFKNTITPHAKLYDLTPVIKPHCNANDIKLV